MQLSFTQKKNIRKNFGKLVEGLSIPNLIEVQKNSYNEFLESKTLNEQLSELSKGIDKVFKNAGFEWREPGCSMCLGMNPDQLKPKERCASTSNRNFEGRQGRGGRTHLVSPGMAVAAAIRGHLADVRELQ